MSSRIRQVLPYTQLSCRRTEDVRTWLIKSFSKYFLTVYLLSLHLMLMLQTVRDNPSFFWRFQGEKPFQGKLLHYFQVSIQVLHALFLPIKLSYLVGVSQPGSSSATVTVFYQETMQLGEHHCNSVCFLFHDHAKVTAVEAQYLKCKQKNALGSLIHYVLGVQDD